MTEIKKDKNTIIRIHGYEFEVSAKKAAEFRKLQKHVYYLEQKIKWEKFDKQSGHFLSSREDSFERLQELGIEFAAQQLSPEDIVNDRLIKEKLRNCLERLSEEEYKLIFALYFLNESERKISAKFGIPQKTLNDKKKRILCKLPKLMKT